MVGRAVLPLMLAFGVLAAPFSLGGTPIDLGAPPCPGYRFVPDQGPSCPAGDGMWWVLLDGGTRLLTHGPDPAPADADAPPAPEVLAAASDPVCATHGTHRQVLVYTVPFNLPDRSAELAEPIRDLVRQANGVLRSESAEFGEVRDYRVECDPTGVMTVYPVILAVPSGQTTFQTIASELQARGFDDPLANYWVWHDDHMAGFGGQGNRPPHDTPVMTNEAARGPHYAITYGYLSWSIMMHENGHNLGAVQNSAPRTTGSGHCIDGRDVMCYADGGAKGHLYNHRVCRDRVHFDCGHNDYFHPRPPPGNYLHDHWNIGGHTNPFLEVPNRCAARPGVVAAADDPAAPAGTEIEHEIDGLESTCGGRHFEFVRVSAKPFVIQDLNVCWYSGESLLRCHDHPDDAAEGTVPVGATRAVVSYEGPGVAAFVLNVS